MYTFSSLTEMDRRTGPIYTILVLTKFVFQVPESDKAGVGERSGLGTHGVIGVTLNFIQYPSDTSLTGRAFQLLPPMSRIQPPRMEARMPVEVPMLNMNPQGLGALHVTFRT